MKRLVLKFGGTSVGTIEKIKKVANIIKKIFNEGNEIIVIVSAMMGATDELKKKSNLISNNFDDKELDVLLSSGEQVSCSLLSGAIIDLGLKARSWQGWQIPILTDANHTSSNIMRIKTEEISNFVSQGGIAVITGFQGVSMDNRITTLGRGGSDLSAVVIAKFFRADSCEIYTDVDGIFTTDPSINNNAKKIDKISYEEMLEMASLGAKVMQPNAVQASMVDNIPIHVKSTFSEKPGTKIISESEIDHKKAVTGIAYSKRNAKVSVIGVVDKPGVAADIFEPIGKNNINVDMVIQNTSLDGKKANVTFTIKREDLNKTLSLIEKSKQKLNYNKIIHDDKLAKVSIIGAGMIANPGVTYKMFRALADMKINILAISTSEIKISVLIREDLTQKAVKALHKSFELN
ncbi:MAG: aspartate kinase [Pelagibacteraceae bacterium]|jgi:aspartate kinase|nr:aspartate kinase [Pelagibacteraceae bacterium]MDP6710111.1 aspartate kinase [Pelagibacteraceae bacterium]